MESLLAEISDSFVVKNNLDDPISDSVKRSLLKPLRPWKYRPSPIPPAC